MGTKVLISYGVAAGIYYQQMTFVIACWHMISPI